MIARRTAIIGAGLAGTLLVEALIERGVGPSSIEVLYAPEAGASAVPGALLHPFPGRTLRPGTELEALWGAASAWAERQRAAYPAWVARIPMVRPLLDDARGERLSKTFAIWRCAWPGAIDGEALDAGAWARLEPRAARTERGAIRYAPAYHVDLGQILGAERARFARAGVRYEAAKVAGIERRGGGAIAVAIVGAEARSYERVAVCAGVGLAKLFPSWGVQQNGGDLVVARAPEGRALEVAMSAGGHVAPRADGRWVVGSTYRRGAARSPSEIWGALRELTARFFPAVRGADPIEVWSGERCVFGRDRVPLAGRAPGRPGVYVLGALGSKGLLWGPHLARELARVMVEGGEVASAARAVRIEE